MVESLTGMINREWNLINGDADDYNNGSNNNHSLFSQLLSRKVSDNNSNHHQHYQSTSDYDDRSSTTAIRSAKPLLNHVSLDPSYDTDGALGTSKNRSKHHHSNDNYEYLISPRLFVRQNGGQSSKTIPSLPFQQRLSHKTHSTANTSLAAPQNHENRDQDTIYDDDIRRRVHQSSIPSRDQGARVVHPSALTPSIKPLRIIFIRHSERADQVFGPDWFSKAFRTNTYKAYDPNLPVILPKRRFDQAYQFDTPLTVRGLKIAHLTGRTMTAKNLVVDICLTSTALRCVQTCERIVTGMDRRDRIPIRIEPGLFECPHYNHKIVDSFMSKRELMENRYNIKDDYKTIIAKVLVPETLEDYFQRSAIVMRGIIERYGPYGGTILIVTHAPGLLALTNAMKGLKTNTETFYRTVSMFPLLAMYIAEYDGSKWKYSNQPFNFVLPAGQ